MSFLGVDRLSGPALIEASTGRVIQGHDLCELARDTIAPLGAERSLLFLLCENTVFTALTYAGAMLVGHALALLDARAAPAMTARVIQSYRPGWIAGPAGTAARLAGHGVDVVMTAAVSSGEIARTAYDDPSPLHPDLRLLLATSGTTGSRRFVRLTAANVESNARAIAKCLDLSPLDRPITSLPLHYSFGLSVLNSHWAVGAPVVISASTVLQRSFWDDFHSCGCTSLSGVPFTYQMLERAGFRSQQLPTLRTLQQAGGALDARLTRVYHAHMQAIGGRLFVMYGQTEATARISYLPPDRLSDKIGSAGVPIPGGRLRIEPSVADSNGHGGGGSIQSGEVVYEGPNVMMGYADSPDDLRKGDECGGVLRTGDLGYLDEEGFLFLTGRRKRIAKVFGLRVNLDDLEATLQCHGPCAVVGGDETVWIFCEFGTADSHDRLKTALARDLTIHASAFKFRRVERLPTTTAGKLDYAEVKRWIPNSTNS